MPKHRTDLQKKYYDEKPHTYLNFDQHDKYAKNLVSHLMSSSGIKKDDEILEVGCGAGRFSLHLAAQGYNIACLDLSIRQMDKLENAMLGMTIPQSNIKLHCGSIEEFIVSAPDDSCDAIIGFFILHHISFKKLQSIFEGFHRILRKGGIVCFLEPNRLNILYFFQILFFADFNFFREVGLYKLSRRSVSKILSSNSFQKIHFINFGFFPPQIINRWPFFLRLEKIFERSVFIKPFLPFMLFSANKQ